MNNLLKREIIMQYKHIIFDLDGTLIDTEHRQYLSRSQMGERY